MKQISISQEPHEIWERPIPTISNVLSNKILIFKLDLKKITAFVLSY